MDNHNFMFEQHLQANDFQDFLDEIVKSCVRVNDSVKGGQNGELNENQVTLYESMLDILMQLAFKLQSDDGQVT